MIRHYLKLTFRNLIQNRVYVLINILGMGLSLACCIIAYLNFDFADSFDDNHLNKDKIYKIHANKLVQDELIPYGITPQALGPAMANSSSAIKMISRYNGADLVMKRGDKVLNKLFACVDKDFLQMFTYPLKYGSASSLLEKGNILLSSETAEIYFGDTNPVGELVSLARGDLSPKSFRVAGVFEKIPQNTSMQFDGLTIYDNYLDFYEVENQDWGRFIGGTFIYLDDPDQATEVTDQMQSFIAIQNQARDDFRLHNFELISLHNLGSVARDVRANWMWTAPHPAAVIAPPIMAFLMLLIACFNFTNTSIAISTKRLQEIGIRKVMGSRKRQLIAQFMTENLILCFVALLISLAFASYLVPAYSAMWEGMTLKFNLINDLGLIAFLFGLLVLTAVLAGAYPSIYISSYEPISILKGTFKMGSSRKFTFGLLTAQYMFTVMALFASVAFARNAYYQESMDMGFNREAIVYTEVSSTEEAKLLRDALQRESIVNEVGVANQHVGRWVFSRTLGQQDFELEADMLAFGENYIETMELEIINGRGFDQNQEALDKKSSIIVNEQLVKEFGWDEPIGQVLSTNDTIRYTVIGVVRDFYYNGFWEKIAPLGILRASGDHLRFVAARTNGTNTQAVLGLMEDKMLEFAPNKPFNGDFQDQLFKESSMVNSNLVVIFTFLGVMAILLSTIGLYTMVSLSIQKRTKEMGIRKVLGASITGIANLMNQRFLIMLLVASILGVSAGFFSVDSLIASIFTYYRQLDTLTIMLPVISVLFVSMAVSYTKIVQSARQNPVKALRYE